ncbi:hypothetical protein FB451DRAFT_1193136 [Mycena latifolia]|nr:hypothetical protein FB451DRAFT_1193136 [Mycena latifolia]
MRAANRRLADLRGRGRGERVAGRTDAVDDVRASAQCVVDVERHNVGAHNGPTRKPRNARGNQNNVNSITKTSTGTAADAVLAIAADAVKPRPGSKGPLMQDQAHIAPEIRRLNVWPPGTWADVSPPLAGHANNSGQGTPPPPPRPRTRTRPVEAQDEAPQAGDRKTGQGALRAVRVRDGLGWARSGLRAKRAPGGAIRYDTIRYDVDEALRSSFSASRLRGAGLGQMRSGRRSARERDWAKWRDLGGGSGHWEPPRPGMGKPTDRPRKDKRESADGATEIFEIQKWNGQPSAIPARTTGQPQTDNALREQVDKCTMSQCVMRASGQWQADKRTIRVRESREDQTQTGDQTRTNLDQTETATDAKAGWLVAPRRGWCCNGCGRKTGTAGGLGGARVGRG